MQSKRVTLYRLFPFPSFKRVTVGRITVRGFREALKIAVSRVLEFSAAKADPITESEALECLGDPATAAALADLIVFGERPGFFRRWHSQKNAVRLMRASREVEGTGAAGEGGWTRMCALIDWTGKKVKRGGGLMADMAALCRIYQGLTPLDVLAMPMQDFLDLCDCITQAAAAAEQAELLEDPTMDPEARPTPLGNVPPGRGKVWVN